MKHLPCARDRAKHIPMCSHEQQGCDTCPHGVHTHQTMSPPGLMSVSRSAAHGSQRCPCFNGRGTLAKECWQPLKAGEGEKRDSPPELPEGTQRCQYADFSPSLDFQTLELCCCKPPSVWECITATTRNQYHSATIFIVSKNYNILH